jgi:hypothetical protein
MLVRTSFMMAILGMLATPLWAQEGAPSGRQELAEQQRGRHKAAHRNEARTKGRVNKGNNAARFSGVKPSRAQREDNDNLKAKRSRLPAKLTIAK